MGSGVCVTPGADVPVGSGSVVGNGVCVTPGADVPVGSGPVVGMAVLAAVATDSGSGPSPHADSATETNRHRRPMPVSLRTLFRRLAGFLTEDTLSLLSPAMLVRAVTTKPNEPYAIVKSRKTQGCLQRLGPAKRCIQGKPAGREGYSNWGSRLSPLDASKSTPTSA